MYLKSWILLIFGICLSLFSFSQVEKAAVISGTIRDARSKLPINEAVITLSSTAFKGQKFTVTDSSGAYRIGNLPPGNYTIMFEMEGYQKYFRQNIALQEGGSVGVNYEMIKERGRSRKGR